MPRPSGHAVLLDSPSCHTAQASECVSDPFLLTSRSVAAQIPFFTIHLPDLLDRRIMRLAAGTAAFSARDKHTAYAVLAVNNLSDIAAEILPGLLHVQNIIRSALIHAPLNVLGHAQQQTFGRALELGERPFARCSHQAIDDWTAETDFNEPLANGCQILAESENFCDAV